MLNHKSERAQGLVEFTLIMPLFLLLIMAIVDLGMAMRAQITVTNSSREGARIGVTCQINDAIIEHVVENSSNFIKAENVTVVSNPCSSGAYTGNLGAPVEVKVTYNYEYISPFGSILNFVTGGTVPDPLPLSGVTKMRME